MTNRREFLQAGVAATALPLAVGGMLRPGSVAADASTPRVQIYKAVFDERYAEARVFGEQVARNGIATRAFAGGDITSFWYDELDLLWRETPVAIAGLTQFGPMFVLDRLGRERGLQTVLRVEHRPESAGVLRHIMSGSLPVLDLVSRLGAEGMAWPVLMGCAVAGCHADCSGLVEQSLLTKGAKPQMGGTASCTREAGPERIIHYYMTDGDREGRDLPLDGSLFSWVIAPKVRA
jgi:hypothetical protein